MSTPSTSTRTVGCGAGCDLVVAGPGVAECHARLELDRNGWVFLTDLDSADGTWLGRGGGWARARRVSLCVGDRLRLGATEVEPGSLAGQFDPHTVRLRPRPVPAQPVVAPAPAADPRQPAPRRDPRTGRIDLAGD